MKLNLILYFPLKKIRFRFVAAHSEVTTSVVSLPQAGGSVPWLAEFQSFLAQLDLASLPPSLPAPTTPTTATTTTTATTPTYNPTTASTQQDRSLAWRLPLLNFILEVKLQQFIEFLEVTISWPRGEELSPSLH